MLDLWLDIRYISIDEYVEIKKMVRGCSAMCYIDGHDSEFLSLLIKAILTDVRMAKNF